ARISTARNFHGVTSACWDASFASTSRCRPGWTRVFSWYICCDPLRLWPNQGVIGQPPSPFRLGGCVFVRSDSCRVGRLEVLLQPAAADEPAVAALHGREPAGTDVGAQQRLDVDAELVGDLLGAQH